MVQVGVLSGSQFDALFSLIGVEYFLSSEPLVLELLVQPINFRPQCFFIDIPALNKLQKLCFGDADVALPVGAE